jgi:hypothetical protein
MAAADKQLESNMTISGVAYYVTDLASVDVAACPEDFQAAWNRHLAAVEATHKDMLNSPSAFETAARGVGYGYSQDFGGGSHWIADQLAIRREIGAELDAARLHLVGVALRYASKN